MAIRRKAGAPLKVVIMSATLATGLFTAYFDCAVITASGRTHPVKQVGGAPETLLHCGLGFGKYCLRIAHHPCDGRASTPQLYLEEKQSTT